MKCFWGVVGWRVIVVGDLLKMLASWFCRLRRAEILPRSRCWLHCKVGCVMQFPSSIVLL